MKKTNVLSKVNECPVYSEEVKSPFAVYRDEVLSKIHATADHTISSINNELDKLLIFAVSELKVSTSSLLERFLHNCGAKGVSQKDIQKRLKVLSASEFLDVYQFEGNGIEGTRSSNRVYMLSWRGAGFLKSSGKKLRLGNYLKELNATQIKKILSATQFLINSGFGLDSFSMCEPVFVPSKKLDRKTSNIFRPQAIVKDKEIMFIESVRQNQEWRKELLNKLERVAAVAQAKAHNMDFDKHSASLLLIGENMAHMKQIMKFVESQYICYPLKIHYTSDTLTYAAPESCIYSVKPSFIAALFSA